MSSLATIADFSQNCSSCAVPPLKENADAATQSLCSGNLYHFTQSVPWVCWIVHKWTCIFGALSIDLISKQFTKHLLRSLLILLLRKFLRKHWKLKFIFPLTQRLKILRKKQLLFSMQSLFLENQTRENSDKLTQLHIIWMRRERSHLLGNKQMKIGGLASSQVALTLYYLCCLVIIWPFLRHFIFISLFCLSPIACYWINHWRLKKSFSCQLKNILDVLS